MRSCLLPLLITSVFWIHACCVPQGENTCQGVIKHPVTVRVNVTEPVTYRTYGWCPRWPPRCSNYVVKMTERVKIQTEMHNRTITVCCRGYVEMENKCVPACPPMTECPNMHCNRTNHCYCSPGYQGVFCNDPCTKGFWGKDCKKPCDCPQGFICHHLTGDCMLDDSRPTVSKTTVRRAFTEQPATTPEQPVTLRTTEYPTVRLPKMQTTPEIKITSTTVTPSVIPSIPSTTTPSTTPTTPSTTTIPTTTTPTTTTPTTTTPTTTTPTTTTPTTTTPTTTTPTTTTPTTTTPTTTTPTTTTPTTTARTTEPTTTTVRSTQPTTKIVLTTTPTTTTTTTMKPIKMTSSTSTTAPLITSTAAFSTTKRASDIESMSSTALFNIPFTFSTTIPTTVSQTSSTINLTIPTTTSTLPPPRTTSTTPSTTTSTTPSATTSTTPSTTTSTTPLPTTSSTPSTTASRTLPTSISFTTPSTTSSTPHTNELPITVHINSGFTTPSIPLFRIPLIKTAATTSGRIPQQTDLPPFDNRHHSSSKTDWTKESQIFETNHGIPIRQEPIIPHSEKRNFESVHDNSKTSLEIDSAIDRMSSNSFTLSPLSPKESQREFPKYISAATSQTTATYVESSTTTKPPTLRTTTVTTEAPTTPTTTTTEPAIVNFEKKMGIQSRTVEPIRIPYYTPITETAEEGKPKFSFGIEMIPKDHTTPPSYQSNDYNFNIVTTKSLTVGKPVQNQDPVQTTPSTTSTTRKSKPKLMWEFVLPDNENIWMGPTTPRPTPKIWPPIIIQRPVIPITTQIHQRETFTSTIMTNKLPSTTSSTVATYEGPGDTINNFSTKSKNIEHFSGIQETNVPTTMKNIIPLEIPPKMTENSVSIPKFPLKETDGNLWTLNTSLPEESVSTTKDPLAGIPRFFEIVTPKRRPKENKLLTSTTSAKPMNHYFKNSWDSGSYDQQGTTQQRIKFVFEEPDRVTTSPYQHENLGMDKLKGSNSHVAINPYLPRDSNERNVKGGLEENSAKDVTPPSFKFPSPIPDSNMVLKHHKNDGNSKLLPQTELPLSNMSSPFKLEKSYNELSNELVTSSDKKFTIPIHLDGGRNHVTVPPISHEVNTKASNEDIFNLTYILNSISDYTANKMDNKEVNADEGGKKKPDLTTTERLVIATKPKEFQTNLYKENIHKIGLKNVEMGGHKIPKISPVISLTTELPKKSGRKNDEESEEDEEEDSESDGDEDEEDEEEDDEEEDEEEDETSTLEEEVKRKPFRRKDNSRLELAVNMSQPLVATLSITPQEDSASWLTGILVTTACILLALSLVSCSTILLLYVRNKKKKKIPIPTESCIMAYEPSPHQDQYQLYSVPRPSIAPDVFFCPTFSHTYAEKINKELRELAFADDSSQEPAYEEIFKT